jgi:hypothetical protein
MNSLVIASIAFAAAFGGTVVGMFLKRVLPPAHLHQESKEVIRLGTGLIATMAALVLGLLVGAAKSSFDEQRSGFRQLAVNIVLLDRALAQFGPDAQGAREQLQRTVDAMLESLWPQDGSQPTGLDDAALTANGTALYDAVRGLTPRNDSERVLQSRALDISAELARGRWQLGQRDDGSLPIAFLVVLAFWFFVLFASFGLFTPRNATTTVVLLICALSVAGAIFLIVDLDQPFDGLIRISSAALRDARAHLGQ